MKNKALFLAVSMAMLCSPVAFGSVRDSLDRMTDVAGGFFENRLHAGECKSDNEAPHLFSVQEKPEAFQMKLANGKSVRMIPVGLLFPVTGEHFKVAMRYLTLVHGKLDYRIGVFYSKHGKIEFRPEPEASQRIAVQSIEEASNEPFARVDKQTFCDKLKETWPEHSWTEIGDDAKMTNR